VARRRHHTPQASHDRWLISYADFITLLFAFFVTMFASSQTDKARAQKVSESVKQALEKGGIQSAIHEILGGTVDETGKGNAMLKGPGGRTPENAKAAAPTPPELLPSLMYLNKALEEEIRLGKVEVRLEPRGLVVSLRQAAFFPSGEDTIDPATLPTIGKVADILRAVPNAVRLEGHTDSIPIHTARFHSNWELSAARGIAMMETLHEQFAIPKERMAIAGYAEVAPLEPNDTITGRAHNRRVDIVMLNQRAIVNEPSPAAPPSQVANE